MGAFGFSRKAKATSTGTAATPRATGRPAGKPRGAPVTRCGVPRIEEELINLAFFFKKTVFGKLLQRPFGSERGEGAGERLRLVRREDGGGRQEPGEQVRKQFRNAE